MPLSSDITFQKALALAASASNQYEAEAAELAARRVMAQYNIDPTDIPDQSLYSHANFADNPLLLKLRAEYRAAHPLPPPRSPPRPDAAASIDTDYLNTPAIPFNISAFKSIMKARAPRLRRGRSTPKLDRAREIVRAKIEADESISPHKLQEEYLDISHVTFDMAITAELARKDALRERIDAYKRQLDEEFEARVQAEVERRLSLVAYPAAPRGE